MPLHFEANHGQTDEQVRFLARGRGYGLFLTATESVLVLRRSKAASDPPAVLRMKLLGANPRPTLAGKEALPGKSNYFIGNDPKKWRTDVPQYARVEYEDVYPGVGLTYYGNQGLLEYDFEVAPGADPKRIRLAIEGANTLRIDDAGNLLLGLPDGELVHRAPVIYQEAKGTRRPVAGRFALRGVRELGFEVDAYELDRPLVIDPLLVYSTYLGGSQDDMGLGIAVDATGNAYVAGSTDSVDFPAVGSLKASPEGKDTFVAKLNAAGSSLVYSTHLGGTAHDEGFDIAVDATGNVYVTGYTESTDFPTVSPFQAALGGVRDAFVTKLNTAGSALVYSTYLGGSGGEFGWGVAVDGSESTYLTGYTFSTDFPTFHPFQAATGGQADAYVTQLNASGSALVYSTYLGGSRSDLGLDIAVDTSGSAYLTGFTDSTDFPTANAAQAANGGFADAFVTKLNAAGSSLVYSTYLGGTSSDEGFGIAVDGSGSASVTGNTSSVDFPTVNPIQTANGGGEDAFVTKLAAAGSALSHSTYLGGSGRDGGRRIAVDALGSRHVTGYTSSANFPTVKPLQASQGADDVFVTKLNAVGSSLIYSTYLGGGHFDVGFDIAVAPSGSAYVTGSTSSGDFLTANPSQAGYGGGFHDAFVARIGPGSPPPGDYDFDGKPDILWRDQASTGHIAIWFMDGTRMTEGRLTDPSPFSPLNWRIVGTADFDGDDKQDILWRDQDSSGEVAVWFMDGTTLRSAVLTTPEAFPLLDWEIVATGDFNGDGKPDLLWRDTQTTGEIAVWFMDGTTMTSATLTDPPSFQLLNWKIVGVGDFNADGKPDILWRNHGGNGEIAVWFMDGTTMTGATLTNPPSFPLLNWEIVGTGDFNADGKTDILWRDQGSTGEIAVWFMDGTTMTGATRTDPPAFPLLDWRIVGPR